MGHLQGSLIAVMQQNTTKGGIRRVGELKKHVAAIHSSCSLTLVQRKIANALLFWAYDDLKIKQEHSIHIDELCNLIGYDSKDFKTIRNSLKALVSAVIEWNLIDGERVDDDGVWNASAIIADASMDGPICTYSYSNRMKELLHHPEIYGRINMDVMCRFRSTYALALYENCVRYQSIATTPWVELDNFRKLMGVDDGKYKSFNDFKKRVIDKAIEEVNEYSNITVFLEKKVVNRIVKSVKFNIAKKADALPIKTNDVQEALIKKFGFTEKAAMQITEKFEEAYITEKITLVESSSSYKNGKIANLASYLQGALAQDYQTPKPTMAKSSVDIKTQKIQKEKEQKLLGEYQNYLSTQIVDGYRSIPKQQKEVLEREFEVYIDKGVYQSLYVKHGLENVLVSEQLVKFLKSKQHELLKSTISFEEFCAEQAIMS